MGVKLERTNMPDRYTTGFTFAQDMADYGNPAFTTYTPPVPDNEVEIRVVQSTNATAPGKRLFIYGNGIWTYVALT
ncbi:MAG: hypothetical protein P4N41_16710 [Negativicutes bacterium]|nr:hypothetical protein [Negativicutes bacterium]MDR3591297.1 hypothetical protein [Negativicutes bacterium]